MQFLGARSVAECVKLVEERLLQSRLLGVFVGWEETPLEECCPIWMIPSTQRLLRGAAGQLRSCTALAWLAPTDVQPRHLSVEPPVSVGRWRRYPQSISGGAKDITTTVGEGGTTLAFGADRSLFSHLSAWPPSAASLLALRSMPRLGSWADDELALCTVPQVAVDAIKLSFQPLTGYHRVLATAGNLISRLEDCDQLGGQISERLGDDSNPHLYLETEEGSVAPIIAGDPAKGMLAWDPQDGLALHVGQRIRLGRAQPLAAEKCGSTAGLRLVGEAAAAPGEAPSTEPIIAPTWSDAAHVSLPSLQSLYLRIQGQRSPLGTTGGVTVTST